MQTYVPQKARRQVPPAHEHGPQTNERSATTSSATTAQMRMRETLNRSPGIRAQMQLQRMLNQRPAVVAQMKLAETLSRRGAIQRQAMPEEEELAQAKSEPAQRQSDALREEEEEETLQGKFGPVQRESALDEEETLQGKFDPVQRRENRTGLPDQLKAGAESLSGLSLDDVRVHYNSPQPATLQAAAYAQGADIHVGPGQETHLPHEAWHIVQQKQGRVQPTLQMTGVAINDDAGLEREADAMGTRALQAQAWQSYRDAALAPPGTHPIQRKSEPDLNGELEEYGGKISVAGAVTQKKDGSQFMAAAPSLSAIATQGLLQAAWRHDGGQRPNDIYSWTGGAPADLGGIWDGVRELHINAIPGNVHIKLTYANASGWYDFYYYASTGTYRLAGGGTVRMGYPTGFAAIDSVFTALHDLLTDWQG